LQDQTNKLVEQNEALVIERDRLKAKLSGFMAKAKVLAKPGAISAKSSPNDENANNNTDAGDAGGTIELLNS
jgi:hypothetical protein